MAILEKEVWVGIGGGNVKYWENKGYEIPRYSSKSNGGKMLIKKGTKILVKVSDLSIGSNVKVTKICDICGETLKPKKAYSTVIESRKDGVDHCKLCAAKNSGKTKEQSISYEECLISTHPDIASLLNNPKQGRKVTHGTDKKLDFLCSTCGYITNKQINVVVRHGFNCPRCSDGISYPEKFMLSLLDQLSVKLKMEASFDWIEGRRYDFYLPEYNCIIETHGGQHYYQGWNGEENALEGIQKIDKLKEDTAIKNGIKYYIVIDSRNSELEWMRDSVLSSSLNYFLDLSKVDWEKCHSFAISSLVKQACDLWNIGYSVGQIVPRINVSRNTVTKYLKQGAEIKWCDYNEEESIKRGRVQSDKGRRKRIVQLSLDGVFIKEWEGIKIAKESTGIKTITNALTGKAKRAGKFRWMYLEDYKSLNEKM